MAEQERSLSERLEKLQAVEPEALREMAALVGGLLDEGDKSSKRRDYLLFFSGAVLSTVSAVILELIFTS
jgi:hypothetical protein